MVRAEQRRPRVDHIDTLGHVQSAEDFGSRLHHRILDHDIEDTVPQELTGIFRNLFWVVEAVLMGVARGGHYEATVKIYDAIEPLRAVTGKDPGDCVECVRLKFVGDEPAPVGERDAGLLRLREGLNR
jgi:hypothetical protein